jgi:hypothetical protein
MREMPDADQHASGCVIGWAALPASGTLAGRGRGDYLSVFQLLFQVREARLKHAGNEFYSRVIVLRSRRIV